MKYIVKQGDHMASIAADHGFGDWRAIWHDDANRALRDQRKNPNVLLPGDKLEIRDAEPKKVSAATGKKHVYKVKKTSLKLALVLQDLYGKPIANARCRLTIGDERVDVKTDGDGKLQHPLPPNAAEAQLTVLEEGTGLGSLQVRLDIGHLDPVTERTGQAARLKNLGYHIPAPDAEPAVYQKLFGHAVEEFQCDHRLTVDGICGPKTQAKLKELYGC